MRVTAAAVVLMFCVAGVASKQLEEKLEAGPYSTVIPGMGRFVYYTEALNWTNAHQNCMTGNGGGHLAYPRSEEEALVLLNMMEANGASVIHLGFHDQFEEGKYVSIRKEPLRRLGFHTWATGKPTTGSDRNCGGLQRTTPQSGLTDEVCETSFPYICKFKLWDDYDLIPGHGYYKLYTSARTWSEATDQCEADGAHLLVLNSEDERDAVVAKYQPLILSSDLWYGVHQKFAFHNFITIFDEKLDETGFSVWFPNHPTGADNQLYPYVTLDIRNNGPDFGQIYTGWPVGKVAPFVCKHGLQDIN